MRDSPNKSVEDRGPEYAELLRKFKGVGCGMPEERYSDAWETYVPDHAKGCRNHAACERAEFVRGFVKRMEGRDHSVCDAADCCNSQRGGSVNGYQFCQSHSDKYEKGDVDTVAIIRERAYDMDNYVKREVKTMRIAAFRLQGLAQTKEDKRIVADLMRSIDNVADRRSRV